jgi:prepilin-type N-terminal cleavage/methylation domain-containing protein
VRRREAGFTLIELLATIAVIGILAAIALPSFFGETRKARARSEVQPMFNDIRIRMEQYIQEHGVYPDTLGEAAGLYPPNPDGNLRPLLQPPGPTAKLPDAWNALNIRISGPDQVRCGYTWVTGRPGTSSGAPDATHVGTEAQNRFNFVAPATDWYYLLAKCRVDPNHTAATDFSWYFTSSVDSSIKANNEGR